MQGDLARLVGSALGERSARTILELFRIHPSFRAEAGPRVSRAVFSLALSAVLLDSLLKRVPMAAAYASDRIRAREHINFDHGALRTVRFAHGPTGSLPAGQAAFTRILQPLGYVLSGIYPLAALKMTGRAFTHADEPELIPQYFVSELHVECFSETFARAAQRVFGGTVDPLTERACCVLDELGETASAPREPAIEALPDIAAAFGCWHPVPKVADYPSVRHLAGGIQRLLSPHELGRVSFG